MCGIAGLFGFELFKDKQEVLRIVRNLLYELQDRGTDATGIAIINTINKSYKVYKRPVQASKFINYKKFEKLILNNEYNLVLLHTRAKTQGDKENNNNNHPIILKDWGILVHNGIIRNDYSLKEEYKIKTDGEVDSEIILQMYKKFKSFEKGINKVSGGFAIGLFGLRENKLYLYKDGNPLILGYVPNSELMIFASETKFIRDSLSKYKSYLGGLFYKSSLREEYKNIAYRELESEQLLIVDFDKRTYKLKNGVESGTGWDNKMYGLETISNSEITDFNEDIEKFEELEAKAYSGHLSDKERKEYHELARELGYMAYGYGDYCDEY